MFYYIKCLAVMSDVATESVTGQPAVTDSAARSSSAISRVRRRSGNDTTLGTLVRWTRC